MSEIQNDEKNALLSISYSIASMFLKRAIEKGYGIEIPSLGIKIDGSATCKGVKAQETKNKPS
jgi:hypothetical protein